MGSYGVSSSKFLGVKIEYTGLEDGVGSPWRDWILPEVCFFSVQVQAKECRNISGNKSVSFMFRGYTQIFRA